MVWIDMKQADEGRGNGEAAVGQHGGNAMPETQAKDYENWWPGMGRWHLGVTCVDATLQLGEPEISGVRRMNIVAQYPYHGSWPLPQAASHSSVAIFEDCCCC